MKKEERKQKMDEFNEKMKELNAKIKDSTDTLVLEGMEAKVAFLEALDAQMEYDEKYGEEE